MLTKQTKIIAGAALVAIVVGGWLFAKHQATTIAQDRIEGFIIRHDLRGKLTYDDLSASPFGSATLKGVKVKISPAITIGVAALDISDVEMKHEQLRKVAVAAHGAEVPLLAIARDEGGGGPVLHQAIGMGYTTLSGDVSLSLDYDDMKGALSFETAGNIKDAGTWKTKISLEGIDPNSVNTLYNLTNMPSQTTAIGLFAAAGQGLQSLASLTLADADITIDNSGVYKRIVEITDQDLPADTAAVAVRGATVDDMELVKAGMAPSEASAVHAALDNWTNKGGALRLTTNLSQPLPLFRNGNLLTPAFTSLGGFLSVTRSRISN